VIDCPGLLPLETTPSRRILWRIDLGMIVGRALMVALGAFYWLYALKPRLPVIRALPYFWRGNLPPVPEWRAFAALAGTLFLVGAALLGPPVLR
jgi:hypothetical protein